MLHTERRALLMTGVGLAIAAARWAHAQNAPLAVDPYADLTDLWRLTFPMAGTTGQTASYDRTGGNADAIFWYYMRAEPRRVVMADVRGPGCISRIWVTAFDASTARIEIFIDGAAVPTVSAWMRDFFGNGSFPPFVPPLATPSTGSWISYVPIPFAKSCRIEAINARADNNVIYYNVSYRAYPPGEPLADVFHHPPAAAQQAGLNLFAQQWANRGQDPKTAQPGQQSVTNSVFIAPYGGSATLAGLAGAGVLSGIRLSISPHVGDSLFYGRIRCRWDGSGVNAVDSPIGAFFGCGYGSANAQALALGTYNGQMYCYLPMPYTNGAVIEIVNPSSTPITASYTITYVPKTTSQVGRYRFHAEGRAQTPASGGMPSYRILSTAGKGHFLGTIIAIQDLVGGWGVLEGDEYIYLDGENYASIRGTGTEDYFNGGFYFSGGPVSLPFNGLSVMTAAYPLWMSAYRLSIPDAVVFRNGLIVDLEHGGVNEGNGNYHSTALFYRDDGPGSPPTDPVNPPMAAGGLVNGDFEGGFGGYGGGEAASWLAYQSRVYYGKATVCTFSAATDQVASGARSQKVVIATPAVANQSAGIAQQVQVARGSSYQVTARVRVGVTGSLQAGDVVARLGLGTAGNTFYDEPSVAWTTAPTAFNTWHTVSAIATAGSDFLTIFLDGLYKPANVFGPATLWIDNVTLEPYTGPLPPPPLPVVDNPSFETAIAPWSLWIGAGGNSDGLERDGVGGAPDGSYALAVKGMGAGGKGAFEYIANNWVTGRQYRLGVYVRNLANSGMRYAIGYATGNTGAAGAGSATYGTEITGSSSWQLATVTFVYAGTNEGVTLYLKAVNAGAAERAGFDKVFIEDLTPVGPPTIALSPTSFSRTITQGSSLAGDAFTVRNSGGGTLSYGITDNASWLGASPPTGSSTGELDSIAINYGTAGLPAGTHHATITIADAAATNSPQTVAVAVTVVPAPIPGDFDEDNDVDQADFGRLQSCLTGSGFLITNPDCTNTDLDRDADVDGADLNLFRGCMSGTNVAGDPDCVP